MKILVINQYNSDNLGDKLLNRMICNYLNNNFYEYENAGFAQTVNQDITSEIKSDKLYKFKKRIPPLLKYFLNYKYKLKIIQKKIDIKSINAVLIGGGQLLKHRTVFLYCLWNWISFAKKNKLPVIIYGVSVDSNITYFEEKIYKKLLKKVNVINVRDIQSQKKLQNMGFNVNYSPDIAFSTKDIKANYRKNGEYVLFMPYDRITAKYSFGSHDKIEETYKKILKSINKNDKIILTATTSSDLIECNKVNDLLKENNYNSEIKISKTIDELLDYIINSKYIITGRMHAMIVGLVFNKKIYPINISNKIDVFNKEYLIKPNLNIKEIYKLSIEGLQLCLKKIKDDENEK